MRILYIGSIGPGSTANHRLQALQASGVVHSTIDVRQFCANTLSERLFSKVRKSLFNDWLAPGLNQRVLQIFRQNHGINVLWLDKAMAIHRSTFRQIRQLVPNLYVVHYFPDDFGPRCNRSRHFIASMPEYDLFLTNRVPNIDEALKMGAKDVIQVFKSFHPTFHCPMELTENERQEFGGQVGFVGRYEPERGRSIQYLCHHGIQVKVWGNGWQGYETKCAGNLIIAGKHIMGKDYVRALNSFDICLGFLTKICRDEHTSRSFEIPGCGRFMLAERTPEHVGLYEEGIEAEFFDSDDELLNKVKYYLNNPELRQRVAEAGYIRAMNSGYSTFERMEKLVDLIRTRMRAG